MGYAHRGDRITITATATSLRALLETAGQTVSPASTQLGYGYSTLVLRAAAGNSGTVYFGKDDTITAAGVNATGFLTASDGVAFDLHQGNAFVDNFFLIGTADDLVYVDIHEM